MEDKHKFIEESEEKLNTLTAKLNALEKKADHLEENAQAAFNQETIAVKSKKDLLQEKIKELKEHGDEGWQALKNGVERAAKDLEDSVNEIVHKYG